MLSCHQIVHERKFNDVKPGGMQQTKLTFVVYILDHMLCLPST